MTQEEKELLLKDLCSRLPYKVKLETLEGPQELDIKWLSINMCNIASPYLPYLFPLSSITEEQSIELFNLFGISLGDSIVTDYIKINECTGITFFLDKGFDIETHLDKLLDWLNKNHFDYQGLIKKGLALDATGLDIY